MVAHLDHHIIILPGRFGGDEFIVVLSCSQFCHILPPKTLFKKLNQRIVPVYQIVFEKRVVVASNMLWSALLSRGIIYVSLPRLLSRSSFVIFFMKKLRQKVIRHTDMWGDLIAHVLTT